jgi:sugar lactone lactonase YvrE
MVLWAGDGDGDNDDNMPRELNRMVIANGFGEKTDPNALVIGPTGLGLDFDGTLYVADTVANRIATIPFALIRLDSAGTGRTVSQNGAINGPLGLTIAPGGDILEVNGNDGNMVEITPFGQQIAVKNVDTTGTGAGTLFGLAIVPQGNGVYFVNDGNNTLNILH